MNSTDGSRWMLKYFLPTNVRKVLRARECRSEEMFKIIRERAEFSQAPVVERI